jgi:hypothetical protein
LSGNLSEKNPTEDLDISISDCCFEKHLIDQFHVRFMKTRLEVERYALGEIFYLKGNS